MGSKLLDDALAHAGNIPVNLEVEETNTQAIAMYEKRGFQRGERVPGKSGIVYLRMRRG